MTADDHAEKQQIGPLHDAAQSADFAINSRLRHHPPLPRQHPEQTVSGSWQLDPEHSAVEFRVRLLWGLSTVNGCFDTVRGRLDLSDSPAIELAIASASVQTRNRKRDKHLCSNDFLDADSHPQVQFVSDAVNLHDDTLDVRGRLSARGRSIPVELDARIHQLDRGLEITAKTTVSHRELGMTYSPLGLVPPQTEVTVKARLIRVTVHGRTTRSIALSKKRLE